MSPDSMKLDATSEPAWYREVLEVQRRSADMIPVYSRLARFYEIARRR